MNTFKKIFVITVVSLLSLSLFASGASESNVDFSSLDFSSLSIEEIESSFEKAKTQYESQKTKIDNKLEEAYSSRNVDEYLTLLELRKSLAYPVVTEEITETLTERILNTENEDEKKEIASFLYENSAYYAPSLTLTLKYESKGMTRTYTKTIVKEPGETVSLPTDTSFYSSIIKGWGITEDEVLYNPGEEIIMPYVDTTLYGILTTGISFSDDVTGYSYMTEESSADVVVPSAPDSSFVFVGWFDTQTGKEVEGDTVSVEEGESKSYKAYWKSINLNEGSVKYYSDNTVPANTQVTYNTTFTVGGNTPINGLTLTLESSDNITVLTKNQSYRTLKSGNTGSASFIIVLKGNSGESVTTTLNATDSKGNVWSIPVTFTIK